MTWQERQDREYRLLARELGCTCPDGLGAHTHREDCPLYPSIAEWAEHLEEEHEPPSGFKDSRGVEY